MKEHLRFLEEGSSKLNSNEEKEKYFYLIVFIAIIFLFFWNINRKKELRSSGILLRAQITKLSAKRSIWYEYEVDNDVYYGNVTAPNRKYYDSLKVGDFLTIKYDEDDPSNDVVLFEP